MSTDESTLEDLAEKAEDHLHGTSLTPQEYEDLKYSIAELSPIFTNEFAYFVLGSYVDRKYTDFR